MSDQIFWCFIADLDVPVDVDDDVCVYIKWASLDKCWIILIFHCWCWNLRWRTLVGLCNHQVVTWAEKWSDLDFEIVVFCVFVIFLLFSISYHRPPEDQVLGFKLQVGDLADQGSSRPAENPDCVNGWVRSDQKDKMVKLSEDQLFYLVLGPRIVRKCSPVTRILTWEGKVHQGTGRRCREGGKHIVGLCVGRSQGFA